MAIRQSTLDIIAKIEALEASADDGINQATVDAAVAEANAAKDALIAADSAEDQENVDAINAALTKSPVTPDPAPPVDTPPVDTTPPADTPPADTPPADTPPADTPADTPPTTDENGNPV